MPAPSTARKRAPVSMDMAGSSGPDHAPTGSSTSTLPFSGGEVPVGEIEGPAGPMACDGDTCTACSGGNCSINAGPAGSSGSDGLTYR